MTIDNGSPGGDAMVAVEGLEDPVGPGSTVGGAAVVNALKCLVADKLTRRGAPPVVLTSAYFIGREASQQRFDECYDDYRARMVRALLTDEQFRRLPPQIANYLDERMLLEMQRAMGTRR